MCSTADSFHEPLSLIASEWEERRSKGLKEQGMPNMLMDVGETSAKM